MTRPVKSVKKLPAVKEAVRKLGVEAPVGEIRKWIKEKYNLELTDSVAHNYTTKARQALRSGMPNAAPARRGRPPRSASTAAIAPIVMAPTHSHTKVDDVVDAVAALKGMTSTLGKTNVQRLLQAL